MRARALMCVCAYVREFVCLSVSAYLGVAVLGTGVLGTTVRHLQTAHSTTLLTLSAPLSGRTNP